MVPKASILLKIIIWWSSLLSARSDDDRTQDLVKNYSYLWGYMASYYSSGGLEHFQHLPFVGLGLKKK